MARLTPPAQFGLAIGLIALGATLWVFGAWLGFSGDHFGPGMQRLAGWIFHSSLPVALAGAVWLFALVISMIHKRP